MKQKVKYLIEPHYVLPYPTYLWPEALTQIAPRAGYWAKRAIRDNYNYRGLANKAYQPGLFDGMELCLIPTGLLDEDGAINWKRLDAYKRSQLPIEAIHTYYELPPFLFKHTYFNVAEYSRHMRTLFKNQVIVASELLGEGGKVIVHAGIIESELYRDRAVQNAIWMLDSVRDILHKKKIYLAVENIEYDRKFVSIGSEPEELKHIHDSLKDPYIKLAFDWGHINTRGPKTGNFSHIRRAIQIWGKDLIYAHIHYNPSHRVEIRDRLYGDKHMPLTRLKPDELVPFADTIRDLMEHSSIADHGALHLEISRRKVFRWFTFMPFGASWGEHKKSLYLLKNIIERNVVSFEPPPTDSEAERNAAFVEI